MLRINQLAGLQGSYINRDIKTVDIDTVKKQEEQKSVQSQETSSIIPSSREAEQRKAERVANLQEISLTFNKKDDYGYIGKDSSLESLDMQKAISDMQKDSILQEYQYFVGSANGFVPMEQGMGILQSASQDGIVIQK